ncbi:MAG: cobalamin biosynthesis protein CbiK [Deltaproteobacteria bacterium]|nr:cobalamin biosynthesis protein CbiK [Deltaproteobacteria bacterium]
MRRWTLTLPLLILTALWAVPGPAGAAQLLTRTLKDKPAIVIAAFGTSTRAQITFDAFEKQLREEVPGYEIRWAFTSEIIRERVNKRWAKQGIQKRLKSLQQTLGDLEAEGYTKVVVQPLHIFPGEEYEEVMNIVEHFPGLRIETGEALLQRWESLFEVVAVISQDFLPPEEGCNVLAAHGTPTSNFGSNITYLGLERHLSKKYPNAFLGAVDGIITREDALGAAKACPKKRVRFIPFMYVAGDHIMNDIMGEEEDPNEPSWNTELKREGFKTDVTTVEYEGETYYKGLGFFPEVNEIFIKEIKRALKRL